MRYHALAIVATVCPMLTLANGDLPMKMWYDTPAQYFEESLPIGNGKLGALIYGGTTDNTIYLNDITFWTGKPVDHTLDADAHEWIPAIREALFKEDYKLADSLQLHVQGHNSQYYQPLTTLHIVDANPADAAQYYRQLDIDSAIVSDRYTKGATTYRREYFASHPDKTLAIRITAEGGVIDHDIYLTAIVPHSGAKARLTDKAYGEDCDNTAQLTLSGYAVGDPRESTHYCAILKVRTKGGTIHAADSTLYIRGASEITAFFINETSFNGADKNPGNDRAPYMEDAMDDAWHLVNYSYDDLRARHIADYKAIYDRFRLSLGKPEYDTTRTTARQLLDYTDNGGGNTYLETLYTQYGRYLLISSSRTPGVPANLQGLWAPQLYSPWRGNYTLNINLEENYWPAEVANMQETVEPLSLFIKALSDNGTYIAKNYYGIDRGWCACHNSDIWAMANPVGEKEESPQWANWNLGGAWLVNTLWEHFRFGLDTLYLRSVAYPLMKGAAEFCLSWLIENPNKPGELITAPSTSPENRYVNTDGYAGNTLYGGTADLAIIRELLLNTLAAAKTLATDDALQKEMTSALERLHPYQIGSRGNLQEWYYDWEDEDWEHRHQSHLIGLYPGSHITMAQAELMAACAKSLEIKGEQTTGWSTGWRINLWARIGNAERAYAIFRRLLTYVSPDGYEGDDKRRSGGTYPNLFDAHPPFQIDGNFGGTAGVCEMIAQCDGTTLTLLPAIPGQWSTGSIKGLRARGGFEISMEWADCMITSLTIDAIAAAPLTIVANGSSHDVSIVKGENKII